MVQQRNAETLEEQELSWSISQMRENFTIPSIAIDISFILCKSCLLDDESISEGALVNPDI